MASKKGTTAPQKKEVSPSLPPKPVQPQQAQAQPSQLSAPRSKISSKPESERAPINVSSDAAGALVVIPPDGGWGWIIVLASMCCNFVADGTIYTFGLFLEDIADSIGHSKTDVALANSLMTGFYYLSGPFVGALVNKYGFRVIAVIGSCIASISILITSFCSTLHSIVLIYGVMGGTGFGMMYLASTIAVNFYFERWRALTVSIASCGSSLGIIFFPPVFMILLKDLQWRDKFRCLSFFVAIIGVGCFVFRPLQPVHVVNERRTQDMREGSSESVFIRDERLNSARSIFSKYSNVRYPTTSVIRHGSIAPPPSAVANMEGPSTSGANGAKKFSIKDCCSCCKKIKYGSPIRRRVERTPTARPLYRDDIFYSASIVALPQYKRSTRPSQVTLYSSHEKPILDYHLSITRVLTEKDLEEDYDCCVCCPEAIKRPLATMLDISVLKSPAFLLLSISGLFTTLGLYTPFMFLVDRAQKFGMDPELSYHLISAMGISNAIGRALSGVLSSIPNVKALQISYISIGIGGATTLIFPLMFAVWWQFAFAVIYGLTMACVASLRPVIVADMLGLEHVTNGFGISMLFQGVSSLSGVPLSGYLTKVTGDYELAFYFTGTVIVISAILLMPIKKVSNWEKRKEVEKEMKLIEQMRARQTIKN